MFRLLVVFGSIWLLILAVGCGQSETESQSAPVPDVAQADSAAVGSGQFPPEELPWSDGGDNYIFRKTWWGMKRAEVKASETQAPVQEDPDVVAYSGKMLGMTCFIGYMFEGDTLWAGRCIFSHRRAEAGDYVDDFHFVVATLAGRYGNPIVDTINWTNPQYQDSIPKWNDALVRGDMQYYAYWPLGNTWLTVTLSGKNGSPQLGFEMRRPKTTPEEESGLIPANRQQAAPGKGR